MELHYDEDYYKKQKRSTRDNPLSLLMQCASDSVDIKQEARYRDEQNRLYRSRIVLTEQANGVKIDILYAEKYIYFDCYIQPTRAFHKNNKSKATAPHTGEVVRLSLRVEDSRDLTSVRSFEAEVQEVVWGSFVTFTSDGAEIERRNENIGLVKVLVLGTHHRSLLVQTDKEITRGKFSIPL